MYTNLKLFIRLIILFFWVFNRFTINVNAKIIKASSCSQNDVKSAIDDARDGDIVLIPEGSATWSNALVIEHLPAITIQGSDDKTIIIDNTPNDGWKNSAPFWIHSVSNNNFRITELTFKGKMGIKGAIYLRGPCKNFRIDNCIFDSDIISNRAIYIENDSYGVIDNCTFKNSSIAVVDTKDESWTRPYTFGSSEALFIENCNLSYIKENTTGGAISGHNGARWIFRFNTIINGGINNHGACTSPRSGMIMEVYNNTWIDSINRARGIHVRGGTGVIFNNIFNGYSSTVMELDNYRSWSDDCGYNLGQCDGKNQLDGNDSTHGWPCFDQIGRATNQSSEPMYEWNNTRNGTDIHFTVVPTGLCPKHIVEGRDFFNDTKRPDYKPYRYPHPLAYPTILSPDSADTGVAINEILQWYPYLGSVSYGLLISKSPTFSDTVFEKHGLTSQKYKGLILDSLTTYYWKINAKYIKEYISSEDSLVYDSLWSETWNFKTGKNTGIIKNSFKKKDGNLKIIEKFTVYPSIIRKRYSRLAFYCIVKKSTNASIEIFNGKGKVIFRQKISPLVSRGVNTPTVIFTWDLKNTDGRKVSSGIYFPVLKVTDKENGTTETFQSKTSIKVSY